MADFSNTAIVDLAATVAEHLQQHNIDVVLVGGLAVEIYTENLYLTKDIDMVNTNYQPPEQLHSAMAQLAFYKQGRVYVNDTTDITVEFPSGPLSVGDELIENTTYKQVANKSIAILTAEDVVKDRLAAFLHWQDRPSLVQATTILLKHQLQPAMFKAFCEREGGLDDYQLLVTLYQHASNKQLTTMVALEQQLTELLLNDI